MNFSAPISSLMTANVVSVNADDKLSAVKEIFDNHSFHHIPVTKDGTLVGLVSKSDYLYFLRGYDVRFKHNYSPEDEVRMNEFTVQDLMIEKLVKLQAKDHINVALELFKVNRFHCIPIVDEDQNLVGIITPFDIIKALADEDDERLDRIAHGKA
jgi:acetoin utilization protein AcuB